MKQVYAPKKGIASDIDSAELSVDYWSDAYNVRFDNGRVSPIGGYEFLIQTPPSGANNVVYHMIPVRDRISTRPNSANYVMIMRDKVVVRDNQNNTWDYIDGNLWQMNGVDQQKQGHLTSCKLNGLPVWVDSEALQGEPWYWDLVLEPTVNNMQRLPGWPTDHRIRGAIVSAQYHLFAINISIDGVSYPQRVMWSAAAEPGTIPAGADAWNPTAENDAGFVDLSEDGTAGQFIDGIMSGDFLWLCKERAIYTAQYVGGQSIWSFRLRHSDIGALSTNCMTALNGGLFLITEDDIGITDGNTFRSVAENRVKNTIFSQLDRTHADNTFLVHHAARHEIWCYFPMAYPNPVRAWIYDYVNDIWTTLWTKACLHAVNGRWTTTPNEPILLTSLQNDPTETDPTNPVEGAGLWRADDPDSTGGFPDFEQAGNVFSQSYLTVRYDLPVGEPQQTAVVTDAWVQGYPLDWNAAGTFRYRTSYRRGDNTGGIKDADFNLLFAHPVNLEPELCRYFDMLVFSDTGDAPGGAQRMRIDSVTLEGYAEGEF